MKQVNSTIAIRKSCGNINCPSDSFRDTYTEQVLKTAQIPNKSYMNLQEIIHKYVLPKESIECMFCAERGTESKEFETTPELLIVQIPRIGCDKRKIETKIKCPAGNVTIRNIHNEYTVYNAVSVISHDGGEANGHYVYNHYEKEEKRWATYNDHEISYKDSKDVMKINEQGAVYILEKVNRGNNWENDMLIKPNNQPAVNSKKPYHNNDIRTRAKMTESEEQRNKENHKNFLRLNESNKRAREHNENSNISRQKSKDYKKSSDNVQEQVPITKSKTPVVANDEHHPDEYQPVEESLPPVIPDNKEEAKQASENICNPTENTHITVEEPKDSSTDTQAHISTRNNSQQKDESVLQRETTNTYDPNITKVYFNSGQDKSIKYPEPSEFSIILKTINEAQKEKSHVRDRDKETPPQIANKPVRPTYISSNTNRTSSNQMMYDERKEISTKKCNIILYGLEESTNPHQEIKEIVELNKALGNSEFTKYNIKRLGRIGDKHGARPLKIELDSHVTKLNIMRKTNLLPNIEKYKHLSIQHDLTKRQHHQLCQLKEESRNLETNDTRGNVKYRVRGPPGKWEIVTFPKN